MSVVSVLSVHSYVIGGDKHESGVSSLLFFGGASGERFHAVVGGQPRADGVARGVSKGYHTMEPHVRSPTIQHYDVDIAHGKGKRGMTVTIVKKAKTRQNIPYACKIHKEDAILDLFGKTHTNTTE